MKYRTSVDIGNVNHSQSALLRHVLARAPRGSRVLDVGCGAGDLSGALARAGYAVTGVDADAEALRLAAEHLEEAVRADLDTAPLRDLVSGPFHAIVLGDVLEHVIDPGRVLEDARGLLAPDGVVVASLPNVAHGAVRLALLQGRWEYTEEGLLDGTHLRFFTARSVVDLFARTGLHVESVESTEVAVLGTEVALELDALPAGVLDWVAQQPLSTAYQFIVVAVPGPAADPPPPVTPLVHLSKSGSEPLPPRRFDTVRTARAERLVGILDQFRGERLDLLTLRDNAIGLEASLGKLRYEKLQLAKTAEHQHEELLATHARLASTTEELIQTHARLASTTEELIQTHARLNTALRELAEAHETMSRTARSTRRRSPGQLVRGAGRRVSRLVRGSR